MGCVVRCHRRGGCRHGVCRQHLASVPRRRYSAHASAAKQTPPSSAAAVAPEVAELPTRLNNTPQSREQRRFFYVDAATSVTRALATGAPRLQLKCEVPETNPEMDVYRIGTVLELVREVAAQIAEDGRRVRVCVQASMGEGVFQGLPLSLNGVARIMSVMDWGDIADFVTFGEVSAAEAESDAQVFILIAPQNVVGSTVMTNLGDMVEAAEAAGKQVVLFNAILKDIPSSGGVMGVRGRDQRLLFASSFSWAYHLRLLYFSGTMYPIVGALRFATGGKWQVYKRVNVTRSQEEYQLWGEWEDEPGGDAITDCLQKQKTPLLLRGLEPEPDKSRKWWQ